MKYLRKIICSACASLILIPLLFINAQTITNTDGLTALADQSHQKYLQDRKEVEEYALSHNIPIRQELPDGGVMEIIRIENGKPIYYTTLNLGAAQTTRADELWPGGSLGLNLTGNGYDKVGVWDGNAVLLTHQEFGSRVTQVDGATDLTSAHPTHVAGTIVASGVVAGAKGMAHQSTLDANDWDDDETEMATAAGVGMEVSNHSYGIVSGWYTTPYDHDGPGPDPAGVHWFGATPVDPLIDFWFGFYSQNTAEWDAIAYNAPYYLIVKAAGNDRNDNWTGDSHYHFNYNSNQWNLATDSHDPDGQYDCILTKGTAKNIMTVGAVNQVLNYTAPGDVVMSTFSGWGPVDDGRIKPDITAKGVGVYSSLSNSVTSYASWSGTSMASPNVTGTLALLQQHYQNTHASAIMRSATLKGLALHSADEAGPTAGPDYMFGWGLLNAERAAQLITYNSYGNNLIDERVLSDGNTYSRDVVSDGTKPLRVTICWTDPAGTPVNPPTAPELLNNRTPMLVNDLDLKVTENGTTFYPWKLDPENPSFAATNTDKNNVDNVEQVYIASPPAGTYTIEVSNDGGLSDGSQAFSLIISGNSVCENGSIIYNSDSQNFNFCEEGYWTEK